MDEQNKKFDHLFDSWAGHWLFNPFYYIAGGKALCIGILIIFTTGIMGFMSQMRLDGPVTFYVSIKPIPLWLSLFETFLTWIVLSIFLLFAGKILSKSRFRIIDIFGTLALARTPFLIAAMAAFFLPGFREFALEYFNGIAKGAYTLPPFSLNMVACGIVTIIAHLMLAWMLVLMYKAFAVSCNVSGKWAIVLFIAANLLSEITISVIFRLIIKPLLA